MEADFSLNTRTLEILFLPSSIYPFRSERVIFENLSTWMHSQLSCDGYWAVCNQRRAITHIKNWHLGQNIEFTIKFEFVDFFFRCCRLVDKREGQQIGWRCAVLCEIPEISLARVFAMVNRSRWIFPAGPLPAATTGQSEIRTCRVGGSCRQRNTSRRSISSEHGINL